MDPFRAALIRIYLAATVTRDEWSCMREFTGRPSLKQRERRREGIGVRGKNRPA